MLRTLELNNFRAFQRFSMSGLGRVNLIVGTNNCGKTSVLEAISILASKGRPEELWGVLASRGEHWVDERSRSSGIEVDVCHLFHGHEVDAGSSFVIRGQNDRTEREVTATIVDSGTSDSLQEGSAQESLFEISDAEGRPSRIGLLLQWQGDPDVRQLLPLTRRGGLRYEAFDRPHRKATDEATAVQSISTDALSRDDVVTLFEDIVLTPEEQMVIEALQTIEPTIERIAPIGNDRRRVILRQVRGGMVVKLAHSQQRIPIGSMGDGIWRMLGIALSLVKAKGGLLLVDEIDTGLHHSVMANMWKMVMRTAERLDVQVFATTHSRDCYESLAAISDDESTSSARVSIQRIERGKSNAVAFSEREIVIAAERAIEVR